MVDPAKLLENIHGLLDAGGACFISTCCNCPAIDHVYQFKSVLEVEELFSRSGFGITDEIILPVNEDSEVVVDRGSQISLNYAAIIERDKGGPR